jgi:single-strand DNA-binding protein
MNKFIGIGRLTRDPELRFLPNGVAATTFTLAIDRPFTSGNGEREADFITCVAYRQLAETVANHLRKGRLCAVDGRLQIRHYTPDGSDKRVYVSEIVANDVRFLDSNNRDNQQSQQQNQQQPPHDPFSDSSQPIDISDNDLPW